MGGFDKTFSGTIACSMSRVSNRQKDVLRGNLMHQPRIATADRQRGMAIFAMLAVFLLVSSWLLLSRLNAAPSKGPANARETARVLQEAKAALLGYAIIPRDDNPLNPEGFRPGELPCPDVDYDGFAVPITEYTSSDCTSFRGWLPWRTLRLEESRDSSGTRLWYAVAPGFNANEQNVLNSDSGEDSPPSNVNTLEIDANGDHDTTDAVDVQDVVAVIIAPGAALEAQDGRDDDQALRGRDDPDAYVAEFLEGENAQPMPDRLDADFATFQQLHTHDDDDFNDRIVYIRRSEVMELAEKFVLGQVDIALGQYRESLSPLSLDEARYPWLIAYQEPTSVDYSKPFQPDPSVTRPGTSQGLLPFKTLGDDDYEPTLELSWDFMGDAGSIPLTRHWIGAPGDAEPTWWTDSAITGEVWREVGDATVLLRPSLTITAGDVRDCTWHGDTAVDCTFTKSFNPSGSAYFLRTFVITLRYTGTRTYEAPTADAIRTRTLTVGAGSTLDFVLDDAIAPEITVYVKDELIQTPPDPGVPPPYDSADVTTPRLLSEGLFSSTSTVPFAGGADPSLGHLTISEEAAPVDMPTWYGKNEWQHFIYVSVAEKNQGAGTGCDGNPLGADDCLRLAVTEFPLVGPPAANNVQAMVSIAGRELTIAGQDRSSSVVCADGRTSVCQYFESANQLENDFQARNIDRESGVAIEFNDQTRIVSRDPVP